MAEGVSYLTPGTRVGRYELRRMLAVGGMAELYLARATGIEGFEKLVVLKRILPHLAADPEFVRLFINEARLAATLHHPNVVEVFDIGSHGGSHYFTMEYVRGRDLGSVIATASKRGEGLLLENALAIVIGVAEGLHHAHEMCDANGKPLGIVHRDVSPSNVLITYGGTVKICDFGIAKAVAAQVRTDGAIKGKASYMSPEQCRGEPLDRRSDVFAMGILLYELTVGKRLFKGANELEVFRQITERDATRPTTIDADYPLALEEILLKALARDREQRYATAQELQVALETFARDEKLLISSAVLGTWMTQLFPDAQSTIDRDNTPTPFRIETPPVQPAPPSSARIRLALGAAALTLAGGIGYAVATRGSNAPATPAAAAPAPASTAAEPVATKPAPPPIEPAPAPVASPPPAVTSSQANAVAPKRTVKRPAKAKPDAPKPPAPPVEERPPLQ
jgi:serine/threonine protein kinase